MQHGFAKIAMVSQALAGLAACAGTARQAEPAKTPAANSAPARAVSAAADGNHFEDPTAGVAIDKRPSWAFMPLEAEVANRRAISVGDENTDKLMHDGSAPPLVVIARYTEPSETPNPTLKINLRRLGDVSGASAVEITRAVAHVMSKAVPSFTLDDEIRPTQVSGLAAGTFRAHFSVEVSNLGRSFVVKTQGWIVPRGQDAFIIAASDPTEGAADYEADFQAMVATIVIRK
jgi:hypothetical protein